jgi:hypothetical protein
MQYDFVIPAGARVFEYFHNQTSIEPGYYLRDTTNRIQRIAGSGCLKNFKESPVLDVSKTSKNRRVSMKEPPKTRQISMDI